MGTDISKGTTYSTGGVGGQGVITSGNLNAHVDDATILPTFISSKTARSTLAMTDEVLVQAAGSLYKVLLSTLYPTGSILQTVSATPYTANTNIPTVIPDDDTIPQITEGTEILTLTITPAFTTSRIRLVFNGFGGTSVAAGLVAALFRTGTANALKTTVGISAAGGRIQADIDWIDAPVSILAQTYTIRVGPGTAATLRMNGISTARHYGGSAACTLVALEIR